MFFAYGKGQSSKKRLRVASSKGEMRVTGSSGETRVAKSTGEKTRTIGGGYRSSLSHQGGARTFVSDDSLETTGTSSTQDLECCSWSSSGESGFHKHAPLLAKPLRPSLTRQEPDGTAEEQPVLDEIAEFGQIMEQQRQQLPGTWYYSSNHILVNRERLMRNIPILTRRIELDALARERAEAMARLGSIDHSRPEEIQFRIQPCRRFGENVACGSSIREIHSDMINNPADLNNMLDRRYSYMGMGTAKGENGSLYFCQIFKG